MATTRIIPMRQNKGKSVAASLKGRIDYAKNPEKTDGGELVSAYECDPRIVDSQFMLSKREYKIITGREQQPNVIAYQVRQSFAPSEITPEEANRIGYEFAMRFLKGNHAFIVATHIDKAHIHNHIIWNSTSLDCTRKWRNFWRSTFAVRRLSDAICIENGLSFVANPKGKSAHYGKWLGKDAKPSHRAQICAAIDEALLQKPKDLSALLSLLRDAGFEMKYGKRPSLRKKEWGRFARFDSLDEGYDLDDLQAVLQGERKHVPRKQEAKPRNEKSLRLLVDIQAALEAGKGVGYERWAKVYNLKQMAKTVNYLTANDLMDYETLAEKSDAARAKFDALSGQIKEKENRLSEIAALRKHIIQYIKTRDVYVGYRKNGYSKKYLAEHEADIILHKAAKKAFDDLGIKKLPSVADLNVEYKKLSSEKEKLYAEYKATRSEMNDLLTAKRNVDQLFGVAPPREIEEKKNWQR